MFIRTKKRFTVIALGKWETEDGVPLSKELPMTSFDTLKKAVDYINMTEFKLEFISPKRKLFCANLGVWDNVLNNCPVHPCS